MGLMFDPAEVLRIAVRIEESGEQFYRRMARRFGGGAAARLFAALADEEVRHRRFYEQALGKLEPPAVEEGYAGEYLAHLQSYADQVLFNAAELKRRSRRVRDLDGAFAFAIRGEMDSILFYQEIRALVPPGGQSGLDEIIEEERRHVVRLTRQRAAEPADPPAGEDASAGAGPGVPAPVAGGAAPLAEEVRALMREAVRLEVQGRGFFTHAAEATRHELGARVFRALAADEAEHLRVLADLFRAVAGGGEWQAAVREEERRSSPVVDGLRERHGAVPLEGGADELEAVRIGMELERRAIELFERLAAASLTEEARDLARRIAEQERGHYDLLLAQHDSLQRSGFWFDAPEFRLDGEY